MKLVLTNKNNQPIQLTGREDQFQVFEVTGLDPGNAIINTTSVVGVDGTSYVSSRLPNRQITILLKLNGDGNAESIRQEMYSNFPLDSVVTLTVTTFITATITGRISGLLCAMFDQKEVLQIVILCDDPNFYAPDWAGNFSWNGSTQLSVRNNGEAGTGFIMTMEYNFGASVESIALQLGTEFLSLRLPQSTPLVSGTITINTIDEIIWIREDGQRAINGVPFLEFGSVFLKLPAGQSVLDFVSDDAQYTASITVPTKIGGM